MANVIGQRRQLMGPGIARQASVYLYSANKLPATLAAGDYSFFTTGIGGTGQGFGSTALTYTETNLQTPRRIPDSQRYQVKEIGFVPAPNTSILDLALILANSFMWIERPEYKLVLGPPLFWPGGCGVVSGSTTLGTSGWQSRTARVPLRTPMMLEPTDIFAFNLTVTAAQTLSASNTAYIILYGDVQSEIPQG